MASAGEIGLTEDLVDDLDKRTFKSLEKTGLLEKWQRRYILTEKGVRASSAYEDTDIRHKGATHSWASYWRIRSASKKAAAA